MATIGNSYTPPEYPNGKETVIKKFINLIFESVENYEEFQLHLLKNKLILSDNEKRQFDELLSILRNELKKSNRIEIVKGTLFRMLPDNITENYQAIKIENFVGGDNYGIQSKKGNFNDSLNQKADLNKDSSKKPLLQYLFWIAGVIIACIAVYNLIIK